ncbi:hypothetical protein LCGC14_2259150 [marine sediment metagenome]|uniref:Uncharacterized protein n=1 Tax=marine sediment metagenome TaxID=412755 RepID=A0A0F9FCQ2_9ZZZZ
MTEVKALLLVTLMSLLLAGLFGAFFFSLMRLEEVSICPPAINEAVRFRLFYAEQPADWDAVWPPEFTERDTAFMEACGFTDIGDPVRLALEAEGVQSHE